MYDAQHDSCERGGLSWQKVCTTSTSVADVGTTTINPTFPSTITLGKSQNIRYSIKNGWANVSIAMQLKASPKLSWTTIATGLPKPENDVAAGAWYPIGSNVTCDLAPSQTLLVKVGLDGSLSNYVGTNDKPYYGSFSYPVAEE